MFAEFSAGQQFRGSAGAPEQAGPKSRPTSRPRGGDRTGSGGSGGAHPNLAASSLSSALANNLEAVLVPLNEGSGMQHLALASKDVITTLWEMQRRSAVGGFELMAQPPPTYCRNLRPRAAGVFSEVTLVSCEELSTKSVEDRHLQVLSREPSVVATKLTTLLSSSDVHNRSFICKLFLSPSNRDEKDCRICHLSLESCAQESGIPIELGCSCKDDLAAAHKQCAETWFKIKGNKTCEICGSTAKNVVGTSETEFIEQWNETSSNAPPTPPTESQSFWHGHRFLNFLLACMVFAFVISWLFHFNVPGEILHQVPAVPLLPLK